MADYFEKIDSTIGRKHVIVGVVGRRNYVSLGIVLPNIEEECGVALRSAEAREVAWRLVEAAEHLEREGAAA